MVPTFERLDGVGVLPAVVLLGGGVLEVLLLGVALLTEVFVARIFYKQSTATAR